MDDAEEARVSMLLVSAEKEILDMIRRGDGNEDVVGGLRSELFRPSKMSLLRPAVDTEPRGPELLVDVCDRLPAGILTDLILPSLSLLSLSVKSFTKAE